MKIGHCRCRKLRHKGIIWGIYVSPAYRGQGFARQLVSAILGKATAIDGMEQVALSVVTENAPAREMYLKLGFKVFGVEPRALKVGDRYLDEEHMVLFL